MGPGVQVCAAPLWQFCTVRTQAPTPHIVWPRLSSVCPSQSSSRPLQVSVAPTTWPLHAAHWPATHDCEPARQLPTPWVPGAPV